MTATGEDATAKSHALVGEGRLNVTSVTPDRIAGHCFDDGQTYFLQWSGPGGWRCTCPARGRCAHLLALGLVVEATVNHLRRQAERESNRAAAWSARRLRLALRVLHQQPAVDDGPDAL